MGNFNKLFKAIGSLIVAVIIVAFINYQIILDYRQPYMDSYLAAMIDKEELLANTPSPKIILIGGSNVAFGLDSSEIHNQTGLPVVNVGLQGGLGLHYLLNIVKPYVNEGDILIISPEYHILLTPFQSGSILSDLLILDPKGFLNLSTIREIWAVSKDFPAIHTGIIAENLEKYLVQGPTPTPATEDEKVYYRDAFDPSTGDITTNKVADSYYLKNFKLDNDYSDMVLWFNINYLNAYMRYVNSKGATAYLLFPATATVEGDQTKTTLTNTTNMLKKYLQIPILNTWEDSQFSSEYMFDTDYHLNEAGRTIHTQRMIESLCRENLSLSCK